MRAPFYIESDVVRGLIMAGIFVTAGVVIGVLAIPAGPARVDPEAPGPNYELLGQRIVISPDAPERALHLVRKYANDQFTLKLPNGQQHAISRAALGAQVQRSRLTQLIEQTRDPASPLRRFSASHPSAQVSLPVPITLNEQRALETLLELKDHVDRPAQDARLDLTTRKLIAEKPGIQLDIYGTLANLQAAAQQGKTEVDAVIKTITPRLRAEQLGNVTFDSVLGYFETNYARGAKHELRTYNLRLAASRLDGHVIMPGETFDFNEVVGPRDEASGYKVAPVIAEGELVDGIGGGTCQISGTLHAAAYFAGIEILSRRAHTRPSSYIKMGLDAAVSYPTITLKLKNPFEFPVVVHETVKNGVVRAEILGPKRNLTVTYVRKILRLQPYEQVERPDSKLPAGTQRLSQRGVPGFRVQKYRIVRDGAFATREKTIDVYPPTTQIVRVGTGEQAKDDANLQDANFPEYTADEYLVITQGPGILSKNVDRNIPGGPMIEQRTPGKTGTAGWMEKLGYPTFHGQEPPSDKSDKSEKADKRRKTDKNDTKKRVSKQ